MLGPMGRTAGLLLSRELRRWQGTNPESEVHLLQPTSEIAALAGLNPLGLFDAGRAREVYPLARAQGQERGREIGGSPLREPPAA